MTIPNNSGIIRGWWHKMNKSNNRNVWKKSESTSSPYTQMILRDDQEWKNLLQEFKQNRLVTNASIKEYLAKKEASKIIENKKDDKMDSNRQNANEYNPTRMILQKLHHICRPKVARRREVESSLFHNHKTFLS